MFTITSIPRLVATVGGGLILLAVSDAKLAGVYLLGCLVGSFNVEWV